MTTTKASLLKVKKFVLGESFRFTSNYIGSLLITFLVQIISSVYIFNSFAAFSPRLAGQGMGFLIVVDMLLWALYIVRDGNGTLHTTDDVMAMLCKMEEELGIVKGKL